MTQQRLVPGVGALAGVSTNQRMLPGGGVLAAPSAGASAPVGRADETDAAFALAGAQYVAVGRADEADTALALTGTTGGAVGRADETDTALALTASQAMAVGRADEVDTAMALTSGMTGAVGLAIETDTALALTASQAMAVGLAEEFDTALAPGSEDATAGGYDDTQNAPRKAKKLTVIHKDDSDERSQEFEALLARVKGQALDKAKSAAQAAPVATQPADIKPPRMPEIRGVEASLLRQWMPDLLSTYRATFTAELQALASAQQAAAQAQMQALQRQRYEDEEIAILAMLA